VRAALSQFVGTHSFHNFTDQKVSGADKTATRYMMAFDIGEQQRISGTVFVPIRYHGQSFMLQQIRNMTSFVTALMRRTIPTDAIQRAFCTAHKLPQIPKAPASPLTLRRCFYDRYEKRRAAARDGGPERASVHFPCCASEQQHFLTAHIYPHIVEREAEGEFRAFVSELDKYDIDAPLPAAPGGADDPKPLGEQMGSEPPHDEST